MIVTLILLLILCLYGIRFGKSEAYNDYISKDRANAIKGIFILIVFISHIRGYIVDAGYEYYGVGDIVFQAFFNIVGQLMVVMFLFYSGYGVTESIRNKGDAYIKAIPRHRIMNTLVNFDIAVCIFLVVDLLLGQDVSAKQFLLSLTTWDSVGNSNWYIFVILICYFVTWLLTSIVGAKELIWGGHFLLLTICALVLYYVRDSWWYNTLWAYPAGIFFSTYKIEIERVVNKRYYLILLSLILICGSIYLLPIEARGFRTNLLSVFFAFLIVVLTMRVKIYNRALGWCGEQLFPLYIYLRIPMMIFATCLPVWMLKEQPLIYVTICFVSTLIITYSYRFFKISL